MQQDQSPKWRATIHYYNASELLVLRFGNTKDLKEAFRIALRDPRFPFDMLGHRQIVIPKDAKKLFRGLPFAERVIVPTDARLHLGMDRLIEE